MSFLDKIPGYRSLKKKTLEGGRYLGAAVGYKTQGKGDGSQYNRHRLVQLVRDAKDAGIHPLYAMGAAGAYQPGFSVGSSDDAGMAMGNVLQSMDHASQAKNTLDSSDPLVSAQIRALNAAADRDDAAASATRTTAVLQLLKQNAQPTAAIAGLGNYVERPAEITSGRPGDPYLTAGPPAPGGTEYDGPYFKVRGSQQGDIAGNLLDLQFLYQQLLGTPGSGLRQGQYFGPRSKVPSKGWKDSALKQWLNKHSRLFKD
ncbi:MAG: hypothetical protein [Microviridae sp.]|nr:MAG: hypothetical protein [Microviridae sp.]